MIRGRNPQKGQVRHVKKHSPPQKEKGSGVQGSGVQGFRGQGVQGSRGLLGFRGQGVYWGSRVRLVGFDTEDSVVIVLISNSSQN